MAEHRLGIGVFRCNVVSCHGWNTTVTGDDFCRDTPLMKRYVATLHDSRVNIR